MKTTTDTPIDQNFEAHAQVVDHSIASVEKQGGSKALAAIGAAKLEIVIGLLMVGGLLAYVFLFPRTSHKPWSQTLAAPCPGERTCVVIAQLQSDAKTVQTDHLISELLDLFDDGLKGNTDVHIIHKPIAFDRQLIAHNHADKLAAEIKARAWLESQNADILIYGRVDKKMNAIELSLVSNETKLNKFAVSTGVRPMVNRLAMSFPKTQSGAFLAALQSRGYPIVKDYSLTSSALFIHEKIDQLLAQMPEGLSSQTAAEAHLIYALSAYQEGKKSNQLNEVDLAIEHMRKAIHLTSDDRRTPEWVQKNDYLARMLEAKHRLGQGKFNQEQQMSVLEQIIDAYRAAHDSGIVIADVEKWGESQIRFSSALLNFGGYKGDGRLIDESMSISTKALSIFTNDSPRHIKNRTSATLWYAIALNQKAELLGNNDLKSDALKILKGLRSRTENQAETSIGVNKKLQNLIVHLEKQKLPNPSN